MRNIYFNKKGMAKVWRKINPFMLCPLLPFILMIFSCNVSDFSFCSCQMAAVWFGELNNSGFSDLPWRQDRSTKSLQLTDDHSSLWACRDKILRFVSLQQPDNLRMLHLLLVSCNPTERQYCVIMCKIVFFPKLTKQKNVEAQLLETRSWSKKGMLTVLHLRHWYIFLTKIK